MSSLKGWYICLFSGVLQLFYSLLFPVGPRGSFDLSPSQPQHIYQSPLLPAGAQNCCTIIMKVEGLLQCLIGRGDLQCKLAGSLHIKSSSGWVELNCVRFSNPFCYQPTEYSPPFLYGSNKKMKEKEKNKKQRKEQKKGKKDSRSKIERK